MPLTKEEIKHQHQVRSSQLIKSWVSPNFGDGGWHATPGCESFDPSSCVPMFDHVLVEILRERPRSILSLVEEYNETGCRARVLKIGPGKWVDGEEGMVRRELDVRPGDVVWIGQHFDWQSQDGRYRIIQEADVRGWLR